MGADGQKRITNSELRTFKECRRRWWLGDVRKLRRVRQTVLGPANLGSRVHGALEVMYENEGAAGRQAALAYLEDLRARELEENPGEEEEAIRKEHELAYLMVDGYCDWLEETGADADLRVVGREVKLEAPGPVDGVLLLGKMDLVVEKISTGEKGFLDHKTVGDLTSPLKTIHLDEQFRMYALIWQLLHPDETLRLQIWSGLKKVKRTGRANPPFFARYEVYISEDELRSFWRRLWGEINDLVAAETALTNGADHLTVAYPTPTRDCPWKCQFYDICPMFDDPRADVEGLIASLYEVRDPLERYREERDKVTESSREEPNA